MSETKTEYVVQFRRSESVEWQASHSWTTKENAETAYRKELARFPQMKHRLIRVTVLKASK